ncbi:hypothetical protein DQ04_27841000, partial [Trypanosoma grayi]|uniref:hypothetical protein n=1 Tax=Trypanosoma grayi TaxID=71804 RepID=UPI0004F4828D
GGGWVGWAFKNSPKLPQAAIRIVNGLKVCYCVANVTGQGARPFLPQAVKKTPFQANPAKEPFSRNPVQPQLLPKCFQTSLTAFSVTIFVSCLLGCSATMGAASG